MNGGILQQFANIDVRFRLRQSELLHIGQASCDHALVDIADGSNLDVGDARKRADVVEAPAPKADNRHAYTIVRTQYAVRFEQASHRRHARASFQKISSIDFSCHPSPPDVY